MIESITYAALERYLCPLDLLWKKRYNADLYPLVSTGDFAWIQKTNAHQVGSGPKLSSVHPGYDNLSSSHSSQYVSKGVLSYKDMFIILFTAICFTGKEGKLLAGWENKKCNYGNEP